MHKFILTVLLFGLISSLHGQEVMLKEENHGNGNIKERYEVLKRDEDIKHGKYESYYYNGKIKESGAYVENQKDGKWRSVYNNGTIVEFQNFDQGKKIGVWEKHRKNHQVVELYDQDNQKQLETIIRNVRPKYPDEAREAGIGGIVKVNLSLNSDCSVKAINLLQLYPF